MSDKAQYISIRDRARHVITDLIERTKRRIAYLSSGTARIGTNGADTTAHNLDRLRVTLAELEALPSL